MNEEHGFHLPTPTVWPAVLGAGIALALFGVLATYFITAFGLVLMVIGLAGWIAELRRE